MEENGTSGLLGVLGGGLLAFVQNIAMSFYNLGYAITHPGLWLDWSNSESINAAQVRAQKPTYCGAGSCIIDSPVPETPLCCPEGLQEHDALQDGLPASDSDGQGATGRPRIR